jgi:hypothetical protein
VQRGARADALTGAQLAQRGADLFGGRDDDGVDLGTGLDAGFHRTPAGTRSTRIIYTCASRDFGVAPARPDCTAWAADSASPGRTGGLPRRSPSEPYVPLIAAYGSSKPLGRAGWLCWFLALAGFQPAMARGVYEACLLAVR